MQNKSAVQNKNKYKLFTNHNNLFYLLNCFIPDPTPEKRDQEHNADHKREIKIWGNYYREDESGKRNKK